MPFTPFHAGPGLLFKGVAPRHLALSSFLATQVVIDIEPLYLMLHGDHPIHRGLHTLPGATAAGLGVALVMGVFVAGARRVVPSMIVAVERLSPPISSEIAPSALLAGGLVGGASHPLLDGLMHPDVRPFAPLTDENPLLGAIRLETLLDSCVAAGIVGIVMQVARIAAARSAANRG